MKYVSINTIMDRVTRHPLMQDISYDVVIDYVIDFITITGIPLAFEDKVTIVKIKNYRGELPCDFYEIIQVRLNKKVETHNGVHVNHAIRYTTDNFHMSENKYDSTELTYKIQGNVIFTSPLKEGELEIAYKALPIDEEGLPALPDNSTYLRAVEAYVKKQWFTIQFDLGKISQQAMAKADQDYAWAVGQVQSSLIVPTVDQMQSITNMWNTLIPRYNEHRHGFVNLGTQEHLRVK